MPTRLRLSADHRARLGLPAGVLLAEQVLTAIDTTLEANAAGVADGMVVVPAARVRDLEDAAAAPRRLHEHQRAQVLDQAQREGKLIPAHRASWETNYDLDPAGTAAHFEAAPVVVPLAELGHATQGSEDDTLTDAVYGALFGKEAPRG